MKLSLYSDPACPLCHRTRLAIAEKNLDINIIDTSIEQWSEEVAFANPYGLSPTLVDRDLVLFDANIIIQYLDERFKHQPLMPDDPVSRAKTRMMLHQIDHDLVKQFQLIETSNKTTANKAKKTIQEDLTFMSELFAESPFLMSQHFSILDCSMAPLLWRLSSLGIKLPKSAKHIQSYAERMFEKDSFQSSLTHQERAMR